MEGGRLSCQTFDELDISECVDLWEGRMLEPYMIGSTCVIIGRTSKTWNSGWLTTNRHLALPGRNSRQRCMKIAL